MAQQVQRGYEVTPLDQLPQRPTAEGVFSNFEARLLGQQAQMHQDLMEEENNTEINNCVNAMIYSHNFCGWLWV